MFAFAGLSGDSAMVVELDGEGFAAATIPGAGDDEVTEISACQLSTSQRNLIVALRILGISIGTTPY